MPRTPLFLSLSALALSATVAHAAPVSPVSYDMLNGETGSFTYFDDTYDGTVSGRNLTGGTGDLTDGVIAGSNWNSSGQTSSTPYVGWLNETPRITFVFDQVYAFNSATFHFDHSNEGGVDQPSSVTINGVNKVVPFQPGSAPFAYTFDLTGQTTDTLVVDLFRSAPWVFLSEVTFDANVSPVPIPASALLLLSGVAGLGAMRRAKRRS
ncbi:MULTISPECIES: VPLPA-CTERM sorting domain-containing protein [unclassified Dinoroseobacter]|uniref:VPLPA-CTERM sorting domain-containing protein n=1 Tax=unclassified Dinoroseobacter TaxID=2620028 RepID=UPI003C7B3709